MAKVLLVEDNEMNRDMLSRRLVRRGFQVVFAMDGQQGIDLARSERPDIILMDMSLPVIDGWEATRHLKADDATRSVPVIGLTAHAMSGDREKAIEAGCDDYDTKPVELDRLISKIDHLLGTAKGEALRQVVCNPVGHRSRIRSLTRFHLREVMKVVSSGPLSSPPMKSAAPIVSPVPRHPAIGANITPSEKLLSGAIAEY